MPLSFSESAHQEIEGQSSSPDLPRHRTSSGSPARGKRILALFPELLRIGGIQQAGRLTSLALAEIAQIRGWSYEIFSLNDSSGTHAHPSCHKLSFRGFARNKVHFGFGSLKRAWEMECGGIVLAGHPNLSPITAWMQRFRPSLHTLIMSHGIEVWQPLAPHRQKALQRADCVLAPSNYTAQKLTEVQAVPAEKVRRLPWAIDNGLLALTREPQKLTLPPGFPHGPTVLTVGRWASNERYKGADELIRAVAALRSTIPDVHMVVAGNGDDLPRLRALSAELGVADHVHFLENLSDRELAACYANADVFALPSTGEGFGLVFLEAMAFSKPVVGVAAGGVTDIVRDRENGFLVPKSDRERLHQTLKNLLTDDLLRARVGAAGSEAVKREYSFDAFRSRLADILDNCAKAAGRG